MKKKKTDEKDPNLLYFDDIVEDPKDSFESYLKSGAYLFNLEVSTLKPYFDFLVKLGKEPGRNAKVDMITEFLSSDEDREVMEVIVNFAYNPYLRFNTTGIKHTPDKSANVNMALNFLMYLTTKKGSSNDDIKTLSKLSSVDEETATLVHAIVNKDLREGAGVRTWSKFFNIPTHGVMLCEDDLDGFMKLAGNDFKRICWSLKLDGVRCSAIVDGNTVKFLSRNGLEYTNFSVFEETILNLVRDMKEGLEGSDYTLNYPIIFDGEVLSKDRDFTNTMTQLKRITKVDASIFNFHIFDIVLLDLPLRERYNLLESYLIGDNGGSLYDKLKIVPHFGISDVFAPYVKTRTGVELHFDYPANMKSKIELINIADKLCDAGEEGIVCKITDSMYEKKRCKSWCKIKKFHTIDLEVVDKEEGTGRNEGVLGALICKLENGNLVKVGSGYDDEQRKEFWKNPPKMIECKYQDATPDSLRFPVFVRERDDK